MMMKPHPMPPGKPRRDHSLLERAAKVYDFAGYAGARRSVIGDAPPPLPAFDDLDPAPDARANPGDRAPVDDPTFLAIPPELRAEPGRELPDDFYETPEITDIATIDRGMLAQAGMIVPGAPVGPLAEEFRLVKRQLLVTGARIAQDSGGTDPAGKARTVLVCSAKPGEGKTFCAVNLALSLAAERDTEVLLVDADFAKPDVLATLGLADSPGLLDALADSRIDVESLVVRTDVGGLSILPAGTKMATDTELLASARTRTVLARLLSANPRRIVIFDSPPALAASPASVLAMLVGQVMMVVRADRTAESDLKQAVGLLDACDHISLTINAVAFVPGGQRFGSYYGQEMPQ